MSAIKDISAIRNIGLACMQIVAADLTEEYLPLHTEAAACGRTVTGFDQAGDHFELWTERRIEFGAAGWCGDLEDAGTREGRSPDLAGNNPVHNGVGGRKNCVIKG